MSIPVEYQSYINNIYQLSDSDYLVLSDDLNEDELELLYEFLNKIKDRMEANIRNPLLINMWAEDNDINYNAAEIDIREYYYKRIETVLADRSVIDEWYNQNDLPIPGTQDSINRKKQHQQMIEAAIKQQDKERAKKAKQKYPPMRQTVSFDLLKKLENQNYTLTDDDEIIINHPNFNTHRVRYTKSRRDKYKLATERLISENSLSRIEFYNIIDCPNSDYYREHFKESFLYECTNPKGKYYEKSKLRTLELNEVRINDSAEKEFVFNIK